ncbi:hypothetical protein [Lujinxingia vulgaris]|uniref:hypothetical protein n=1 Tax=Lujinxingia vulgaris TaxID=2600176 RepID=UPI001E361F7A|nr:hypothetical protein [Lujinxingia vulgaris]
MGLLLGMPSAYAHQSDESTHLVEIDRESGLVEQLVSISAGDLAHHLGWVGHGEEVERAHLEEGAEELESYMVRRLRVWADEAPCTLEDSRFVNLMGQDGRVHLHVASRCEPGALAVTLENRVMMEGPGGYRHVGRAQAGDRVWPMVFDVSFPTYVVNLPVEEGVGVEEVDVASEETSKTGGGAPGDDTLTGWMAALIAAVVAVGVSWWAGRAAE